jgi:hypothetical protein
LGTIIEVKPLDNYIVWIRFSDNSDATINIKPFITEGISAKLSDYNYFKQMKVDESGGIAWENGFDFCPNYLREMAELKD